MASIACAEAGANVDLLEAYPTSADARGVGPFALGGLDP
jgi:hypothetical protein